MKIKAHSIDEYYSLTILVTAFLLCSTNVLFAQESTADEKDTRPVKNMFESIWLIDNQTAIVPFKGTFEFDILHRFGTWGKWV